MTVSIQRTTDTVTVTVTGKAPVMFTLGDVDVVTATISMPKERMS
ncbi:Uncharacterised protein [Mycobacteroides abscessus subsp. abscessus]|nr:Uncharacterised protein [Mycobacteroides abscessus subsp. abscessus]